MSVTPFAPEDTLPVSSLAAVCEAYGLGRPLQTAFVARGSMGAVNRVTTDVAGSRKRWTVKRAYWGHYTEDAIQQEVEFTERCRAAGVRGPRSIPRVDTGGFVLTLDDQPGSTQYRVLDWLDGRVGSDDDPATIEPIASWLAAIHRLAADTLGEPIDEWFTRVGYRWDELATRLGEAAPDLGALVRSRRDDLLELTKLVNAVSHDGAVWCHTDVGAENLIWREHGPWLIDWENSGPLVPLQELGSVVRSRAERGIDLYAAYRRAGGPAEFSEPSDLATSVAVHLNYLGCQADLLLDSSHPEQHDFARERTEHAARTLPTLADLEKWIDELKAAR